MIASNKQKTARRQPAILDDIAATDQSAAANALADRLTRGTTSKRGEVQVLFIGENLALVKHKGASYSNRDSNYVPGHISLYALHERDYGGMKPRTVGWEGQPAHEVWDLDTRPAKHKLTQLGENYGRLSPTKLLQLVLRARDLDPKLPALLRAHKAAQAELEQAKQRAQMLERARDFGISSSEWSVQRTQIDKILSSVSGPLSDLCISLAEIRANKRNRALLLDVGQRLQTVVTLCIKAAGANALTHKPDEDADEMTKLLDEEERKRG